MGCRCIDEHLSATPYHFPNIFSLQNGFISKQTDSLQQSFVAVIFLLATLFFLISPLLIYLRRYRVVQGIRYFFLILLIVWAMPKLHTMTNNFTSFTHLFGYYIFAASYTLAFLAIMLSNNPRQKRGFDIRERNGGAGDTVRHNGWGGDASGGFLRRGRGGF